MKTIEVTIKEKKRVIDIENPFELMHETSCDYPVEIMRIAQEIRNIAPDYKFDIITYSTGFYLQATKRTNI